MPARKAVTWAELRVGVLVLATIALLAVFVFYATGGGRILASQTDYRTYLPDVAGLKPGAPVRLAGLEVGTVQQVRLTAEFPGDRSRQTEIFFRLRRDYADYVRSDSRAFITTEGLLGESVLEVDPGLAGDRIPAGGAVPGTQRGNIKTIVENVDQITGDIRQLTADVRAGKGTLGKLFTDPQLFDRANRAVSEFQSLTQRAAAGEGTLGRLVVSTELYDQLRGTATKLDDVATELRAGHGTLGQLIYQSDIHDQAKSLVESANRIVARVEAGEGTLGKLVKDSTLHDNVNQTFANAREITRKLNQGEGAFGRAVNDPALYDNINEFSVEMRELIADFRKNPKKYLRIKLSLF